MGFRTSRPLRVALSLRMNSYKSPEKQNPTSNPSGDRDVYLFGRAKRRAKNVSKTSSRTSLGKRFFHMSGSEKRAMTQLDLVSTRIMATVRSIISMIVGVMLIPAWELVPGRGLYYHTCESHHPGAH